MQVIHRRAPTPWLSLAHIDHLTFGPTTPRTNVLSATLPNACGLEGNGKIPTWEEEVVGDIEQQNNNSNRCHPSNLRQCNRMKDIASIHN